MSRRLGIALSLVVVGVALWLLRQDDTSQGPQDRAAKVTGATSPDRPPPAMPGARGAEESGAAPDLAAARRQSAHRYPPGLSPAEVLEITIRIAREDPDPHERALAVQDLALEDDLTAVLPVFQEVASDPDRDVKLALINALGLLAEGAPPDVVEKLAQDSDTDVRLEALSLAETLAEEDAMPTLMLPILERAARDPDEDVADQAKDSLRYLAQLRGEEVDEDEEE